VPVLFGVVLLDLIGFGIVIPILPFLSPQLGADKLDIAYIIVVYAVGAGLFAPLWQAVHCGPIPDNSFTAKVFKSIYQENYFKQNAFNSPERIKR